MLTCSNANILAPKVYGSQRFKVFYTNNEFVFLSIRTVECIFPSSYPVFIRYLLEFFAEVVRFTKNKINSLMMGVLSKFSQRLQIWSQNSL